MADPKKTASKSTTKKTTSNKSNTGIKPVTGKIVPFSGKIEPFGGSKTSTTKKPTTPSKPKSSTPSKPKTTGKPSSSATVKKSTTSKPVAKSTTTKPSAPKYVQPGTKAYWAMTPDQRNANTMLNIKASIAGPKKSTTTKKSTTPSKPTPRIAQAPVSKSKQGKVSYNPDFENKKFVAKGDMMVPERKTTTGKNVRSKQDAAKIKGIVEGLERAPQKKKTEKKPVVKPVAPKMPTVIGSAKASVPSKGKVKIEPNMGKPKSFTAPKTETKPKVQTAPKPEPRPEPIKMETIPLATVAKQLQDSRPKAELEIPKSVATAPKTTAPAEEKKGIFARMKERREARKAEKEAEKRGSAGNALAMRKGGMVKYKKGGSIKKSKKK